MKCITCESFSFNLICKKCQVNLLQPNFFIRDLSSGFKIYSFYGFEELQKLVACKYEFFGDRVFDILSTLSFKEFSKKFEFDEKVFVLPIDDHTRHGFSQTAILAKALKSQVLSPIYASLRAKNDIKYAGKDLDFRLKNPRNFQYKGQENIKVILVDDVVTTGTTMLEAKNTLQKYGCEVLFGLALCDAQI